MWWIQKVASKWNRWLRDSLCALPVDSLAGRRWWWFQEKAALRRSCLGMQAEQGRRTEGARNKRWWWEENEKLKCALPWGDLRKWPQIAQWHASSLNSSQKKGHALCLCFICCHDEAALERWQKRGGFGGVECMVRLRSDYRAQSWGMRAKRVFYFVNWSVQMEMSERPEN